VIKGERLEELFDLTPPQPRKVDEYIKNGGCKLEKELEFLVDMNEML
jgi:hypothetical protein